MAMWPLPFPQAGVLINSPVGRSHQGVCLLGKPVPLAALSKTSCDIVIEALGTWGSLFLEQGCVLGFERV